MSFGSFKQAPDMRPQFNVGFPFDIMTGRYHTGKHGESILSGGLNYLTGIAGRGNTFKTTIGEQLDNAVLNNYAGSVSQKYETEISGSRQRKLELCKAFDQIRGHDLFELGRTFLTDASEYSGTAWFEKVKEVLNERAKNRTGIKDTPFIDSKGKYIPAFVPWNIFVDSLSMFRADVVAILQNKGGVGDSERNVEALRDAASKSQFLGELPVLSARSGTYFILTAHVGDRIQMDPYAPNPKKLEYLRNNAGFKHVPEKFSFLMNDCWMTISSAPLVNQATKAPEFPRDSADDMKGDTDLVIIRMMNLRSKTGASGLPIEVVASQSEGFKEGLSAFWYIRSFERFGLGGNVQNYFADLYPDCKLSRTTIRGKIDTDPRLTRALIITAEMCQIKNLWHDVPDGLMCTPAELYAALKAKGYDWDQLLDTRNYWVFTEDDASHPKRFLSTYDLLNMRLGTYRPYWMDKATTAAPAAVKTNARGQTTAVLHLDDSPFIEDVPAPVAEVTPVAVVAAKTTTPVTVSRPAPGKFKSVLNGVSANGGA